LPAAAPTAAAAAAARRRAPAAAPAALRARLSASRRGAAPAAAAAARAAAASPAAHDGPVPWPGAPAGDLDARPPLSILRYPDPRLRAPNAELGPAAFAPGAAARRLADLAAAMTELMYELSHPFRLFV
jgi:hypothetical protein